jgi:hypothetical protein
MIDKSKDYGEQPLARKGLMREQAGSKLPGLDYKALQFAHLDQIKKGRATPMGRFENLAIYLKDRSGKEQDAAELDRRLRTFFEDMITRILKSPDSFDNDSVEIDGKALMNFLSGMAGAEGGV